jgi:hypothetical protein
MSIKNMHIPKAVRPEIVEGLLFSVPLQLKDSPSTSSGQTGIFLEMDV